MPVQRVDAVVPGDALALPLAEELQRLAPFGMGNPEPSLLVPSALLDDPRADGGGPPRLVHARRGRRALALRRLRARELACPPRPASRSTPRSSSRSTATTARSSRGSSSATPSRRGRRRSASSASRSRRPRCSPSSTAGARRRRCSPRPPGARGRPARRRRTASARSPGRGAVRDVRGGGIAGLLGDLVAGGAPVLAVAAHAEHRARALRGRVGGFDVTTWAALAADPGLADGLSARGRGRPARARAAWQAWPRSLPGEGWVHFAWGEAERELAARVLTWELDLRAPLAEAYRALRAAARRRRGGRRRPVGPGDRRRRGRGAARRAGGHGRPAAPGAVAGRLLRVLAELELVVIEGDDRSRSPCRRWRSARARALAGVPRLRGAAGGRPRPPGAAHRTAAPRRAPDAVRRGTAEPAAAHDRPSLRETVVRRAGPRSRPRLRLIADDHGDHPYQTTARRTPSRRRGPRGPWPPASRPLTTWRSRPSRPGRPAGPRP